MSNANTISSGSTATNEFWQEVKGFLAWLANAIEFCKVTEIRNNCGDLYLYRLSFFNIRGYSLKLHVILRSDGERDLHDHRWTFFTLMLAGGYWEQKFATDSELRSVIPDTEKSGMTQTMITPDGGKIGWINDRFTVSRWVAPGALRVCKSPYPHRLQLAKTEKAWPTKTDGTGYWKKRDRPAVTLVFMMPPKRRWGFYTRSGWVDADRYQYSEAC